VTHAALPASIRAEHVVNYSPTVFYLHSPTTVYYLHSPTVYDLHSPTVYDLRGDVTAMLELGGALIGTFQQPSCTSEPLLEPFKVPDSSLSGKSGSCEEAQRDLPHSLASDARVIRAFDALVEGVVLPRDLTARFAAAGAQLTASTAFYYQHPPTLRLQPRPSTRHVRRHHTTPSTAISAENSQLLDAAHRLFPRCTLVNIQLTFNSQTVVLSVGLGAL
jgi:hypothetical protein